MAQFPAVLVIAGTVVAVVALLPRWAVPVSWLVLGASILTGPMFGPDLGLPRWVLDISPFTHSARAPAADVSALAVVALVTVSVALAAAGIAAFRRRDIVPA